MGNILTKFGDIANELYQTQQSSFHRQTLLCKDTTDHPNKCMCSVRKYPWHTNNGFNLYKRSPNHTNQHTIYAKHLRQLYQKTNPRQSPRARLYPIWHHQSLTTTMPRYHILILPTLLQTMRNPKLLETQYNHPLTQKKQPHSPHQLKTYCLR